MAADVAGNCRSWNQQIIIFIKYDPFYTRRNHKKSQRTKQMMAISERQHPIRKDMILTTHIESTVK